MKVLEPSLLDFTLHHTCLSVCRYELWIVLSAPPTHTPAQSTASFGRNEELEVVNQQRDLQRQSARLHQYAPSPEARRPSG